MWLQTQTAGAIGVVLVFGIIGSGFVPYITALHVVKTPYATVETTSVPFTAVQTYQVASTSTTTTVLTQQSITTTTFSPYDISQFTISCNKYVYQSASLSSGDNLQVVFSTSDTVDAYVLSSGQYASYSGGTTGNYEAAATGQSSGTFGFNVAVPDTYYLVIWNPHSGLFCLGGENVAVYSAVGTATRPVTVNYFVTETNTVVVYQMATTTVTLYSASSYSTTLTSTTTRTCTQGWLQALFGCS